MPMPPLPRRQFLRTSALGLAAATAWRQPAALAAATTTLPFKVRRRVESQGSWTVRDSVEAWNPAQTAAVVCDMWDLHHCKNATDRVGELAPRMNAFLTALRKAGVLIIHAPSSCVKPYEDTAARRRAKEAPAAANRPKDIGEWCHRIPAEERGTYPIDQSDGGCDTPNEPQKAWAAWLKDQGRNPGAPWLRQIDVLEIKDQDAVSDSGVEIWNLTEARTIRNVLVMGVHTNMCVLGRPFGLRQMSKNGRNTVLVRDLTDTMYNPAMKPNVDHFTGTDLIVEHIEKFVAGSVTSASLLGGKAFRFKADSRATSLTDA